MSVYNVPTELVATIITDESQGIPSVNVANVSEISTGGSSMIDQLLPGAAFFTVTAPVQSAGGSPAQIAEPVDHRYGMIVQNIGTVDLRLTKRSTAGCPDYFLISPKGSINISEPGFPDRGTWYVMSHSTTATCKCTVYLMEYIP